MISSNTIVKNGMPFIGKVLRQVAPFMDELVVTISRKSNDGTIKEVESVWQEYPDKIKVDFENTSSPALLTEVRNRQVEATKSDWILFLDDDDYWPQDQLKLCLDELPKDPNVLAYSVTPWNLTDFEHYDPKWEGKSFSKFLRKEGLKYIGPWPKDLPADKNRAPLYWKTHPQVKTLPYRFYHLAYLKKHSFREEPWAGKFKYRKGNPVKLPQPFSL